MMDRKKLQMLPAGVMLIAGLITSVEMFCFHYELKKVLVVLLVVLIAFYILGSILAKVIMKFEDANEAKRKAQEEEAEGKVVEKDGEEIKKKNADSPKAETNAGKRPTLDGQKQQNASEGEAGDNSAQNNA